MSDPFAELDQPLPHLKVTCTSTDCENDLHCYLQKRTNAGIPVFGPCRECRSDPTFDIERIRRRDPGDIKYTFRALRHELIRSHMWRKPFDADAARKARRKGVTNMPSAIESRLRSSIGRAAGAFDGRQTAMGGNVIFYAQHATATCCRKCLSYWHGIPKDRKLTDTELRYCAKLVETFIVERWPEVDESEGDETDF
jgi:hypothetical protein